MEVGLATSIGGVIVVVGIIVVWARASRRKPQAVDPIASTTGSSRTLTGSNRTLTGTHAAGSPGPMSYNDALRRLVAYALDDAPREALSQPPNPEHAPVFQAVQQILEKIEARPEYIPRRPSLLPKLLATVNDNEATLADVAATSPESVAMAKELKRRGLRFVGPTTCYALMQAAGLVDDHVQGCWRAGS